MSNQSSLIGTNKPIIVDKTWAFRWDIVGLALVGCITITISVERNIQRLDRIEKRLDRMEKKMGLDPVVKHNATNSYDYSIAIRGLPRI